MRRGISAEQWAAIRAVREDAPPTFPLLAVATAINVSTLRERASREGWLDQPFQSAARRRGRAMILSRWRAEPELTEGRVEGRLAALDAAGGEGGADWRAAATPAERLERLGAFLTRQVDAIIETVEITGARLDRQGIDALSALLRLSEKALALVPGQRGAETDAQEDTRSDDELAEMLRLLDDRVVELAALHAEWLVAHMDRPAAG